MAFLPCSYCGVRPDVQCSHRHREAMPERPPMPEDKRTTRDHTGQGYNFHRRKERP